MKVLILFVIAMFLTAAFPRARALLLRRWILLGVCAVVALSYLSLKVSG